MGLPRAAISLLLHEASRQAFQGTIATLGRQHVYATANEVRTLAAKYQVNLTPCQTSLHREPDLASLGFISDDSLYQLLGFSESIRIDCSDYEDPDEILDLNQAETPNHLQNRFDLVLDSGTIEHVFDIPAVLRHCCRMVRPGGRIIHLTPTSNCVEHGFYSFSPTLYADFYAASGFEVNRILLCQMPTRFERRDWRVYDYLAAGQRSLPLGRLDGSIWFTFAVVTAQETSSPAVPQQSFYEDTWSQSKTASPIDRLQREPPDTRAGKLLRATQNSRLLSFVAQRLIRTWRDYVNWRRDRRRGRVPYPFLGRF